MFEYELFVFVVLFFGGTFFICEYMRKVFSQILFLNGFFFLATLPKKIYIILQVDDIQIKFQHFQIQKKVVLRS